MVSATRQFSSINMLTDKNKRMYERSSKNRLIGKIITEASYAFADVIERTLLDVNIIGNENLKQDSTIYVGYHNTAIDPPLVMKHIYHLSGKLPHALMDARSFSRNAISPFWYGVAGMIPFDIGDGSRLSVENSRWSLNAMENVIKKRESLLVYADGPTRRGVCKVLEERPNSSIPSDLSFKTNSPIQPICIWSKNSVVEDMHIWKGMVGWKYLFDNRKVKYTISFLSAVYPESYSNPKEMKEAVRQMQIEEHYRLKREFD